MNKTLLLTSNLILLPIPIWLALYSMTSVSPEKVCSCGTWKVPSSYKGDKYAYQTVLCGSTINKRNKNNNCEDQWFYVSEYNDFNDTLTCYKIGSCPQKEKCLEDEVEKNKIPNADGLASRCVNFMGEAWSRRNCKCPDVVEEKSPLKEWAWTKANIKPEDMATQYYNGRSLDKSITIPNGYHSTQVCGSELNMRNRNFACAYQTIYECKKWNGTNPFNKPKGLVVDIVLSCGKKCIGVPNNTTIRQCST